MISPLRTLSQAALPKEPLADKVDPALNAVNGTREVKSVALAG
jgi:hypothetical protein